MNTTVHRGAYKQGFDVEKESDLFVTESLQAYT
jgi:hypothetical protein